MSDITELAPWSDVRTPWWRRLTSVFGLGAIIVVGAFLFAAATGMFILVFLFLIEKALA